MQWGDQEESNDDGAQERRDDGAMSHRSLPAELRMEGLDRADGEDTGQRETMSTGRWSYHSLVDMPYLGLRVGVITPGSRTLT